MTDYRIRRATPADLDALLALERRAFTTDHLSRRQYRRHIGSDSARVLTAVDAGGLLGKAVVFFRSNSDIARLYSIAVAAAVSTPFGAKVKISVLANDSDPNGLPLTVTAVTPTNNVHASATVNADGTISYKPDPESSGQDSFSYTISNTYFTASAVVTVTVQAALPPVAQNDFMLITFNTPTEVPVLANDSDPNGLPLTILTPVTTLPQHGTATVNNVNGTITYSPNLAPPPIGTEPQPYVGSDTFSYTITNSFITATATVTVNVQPPPKPVAVDDAADCNGGLQVNIAVLDNDVAQFGLPLKVIGTTAPVGGGSVLLNGDNTITYNDDVDSGPRVDTFSYTITDPYGQQSTATVTVTIIN